VIVHVVQSGDTLYGIAAQYGVSGDTILEANADTFTSPDRLSIGQELKIPVKQPESVAEGEEQAAPGEEEVAAEEDEAVELAEGEEPAPAEAMPAVAQVVTYTVQLGDTLEALAEENGLAVEELRALNTEILADPAADVQPGMALIVQIVPVDVAPAAKLQSGMEPGAGLSGELGGAVVPPEELGQELLPAPLALSPGDGITVTVASPLLVWSSSGVLPPGVYYAVAIRDAASPESEPEMVWVTSNATAVRVPAKLRPALGAVRELQWSVSARRRVGRLIGPDTGVVMSGEPEWRAFTWAPGG
jgi:LysM repeat protein